MYTFLELFVGILLTEWTFIFGARRIFGRYINEWYSHFGAFAILSDVSSIFIGIMIAMYLYTGSLAGLIAVAVGVQWVHDLLFYNVILSIPKGTNEIIDLLKPYGADAGIAAVIGDSWMMVGSLLGAHAVSMLPLKGQIFSMFVSLHILPYAVYQEPSLAH